MKAPSLAMLLAVLLLAGCQSDSTEYTETEADAPAPEAAPAVPATILAISHGVADYDAWRAAYDSHGTVREEAGTLAAYVVRDNESETRVHVFAMFADSESAHGFIESRDLAEAMLEAGVVGEPEVAIMDVAWLSGPEVDPGTANRVLVVHPVADYEAWKVAFDEHEGARAEAGLTTLGIGRDEDNPNTVRIMFAAADVEMAKAFVADPALAEAMESAGVTGPPAFMWGTDVTQY